MLYRVVFVMLVFVSTCFAQIEKDEQWLQGRDRVAKEQKTSPPAFTDEEHKALPDEYGFEYKLIDRNGIQTPMINGRFPLGVAYGYGSPSIAQVDYDTKYLASAGINMLRGGVRSIPKEGGEKVTIDRLKKKTDIFERRGIACLTDYGMLTSGTIKALYAAAGKPLPKDYAKWFNGIKHYKYKFDMFSEEYRRAQGQILAELMKAQGPATVGYIYSDEPHLDGYVSESKAAVDDWQTFLKRFYKDETPDKDTNKDNTTFDEYFKQTYTSWDQVKPFSEEELTSSQSKKLLNSIWIQYAHARFVDTMSEECQKVLPESTVGEAYNDGHLVSLLNAMPHNKIIGYGNYGRIGRSIYITSAAHAYNKPGFSHHINRFKGNYYTARYMGVASLPFTAGQLWWPFKIGVNDGKDEDYGWKYGLSDWWEVNDGRPKSWDGKLNRIVQFDSRYLVISQIAPFLGKFDSMPKELENGVLWIDPASSDAIRNNHIVNEEALVLGKQKLDIDRYKLVMFMKPRSAMFAETYDILREYVKRGGTVLFNINDVGQGSNLFGQSNARQWMAGYQIGRAKPPKVGEVIYEDKFNGIGQWQKDIFSHEGAPLTSDVSYGTIGVSTLGDEGSFVYKFQIPQNATHFRISDKYRQKGGPSKVKMSISNDNKSWKVQHDTKARNDAYEFTKVYSVAGDLDGKRDLYIQYYFKCGMAGKKPGQNNMDSLFYFKLEGYKGDESKIVEQWEKKVNTTGKLGDVVFQTQKMNTYVLPGKGVTGHGEITDDTNAKRPLVVEKPEGKGRWLAWNYPQAVLKDDHDSGDFKRSEWNAQWKLLDAVVRKFTKAKLESYDQPYVAQDDNCLMAVTWDGAEVSSDYDVQFKAASPKTVVFEVFDEKTEGGAFIESKDGAGGFKKDLSKADTSHIWIVKPFGKPIVLCADGTVKHMMKIDDGKYDAGALTFTMAQKASISSTSAPVSVTHNGEKIDFTFDEFTKIVRVKGTGKLGECKLKFEN